MQQIAQLALHIVQWALHLWWVWCLGMLGVIVLAALVGKFLGRPGTRSNERR